MQLNDLNNIGKIEISEKTERKIIRKILGPRKYGKMCYETGQMKNYLRRWENFSTRYEGEKRLTSFYAHIRTINNTRLAKRIILQAQKFSNTKKNDLNEAKTDSFKR